MPSTSLTPYKDASNQITYTLMGSSPSNAKWSVSGYGLGVPRTLEQTVKIGPPGATGNDHVTLKLVQSDQNSSTGKNVTCSITVDISIPRDAATITPTEVGELLGVLSSLLNDAAAVENYASATNRTALAEGRIL